MVMSSLTVGGAWYWVQRQLAMDGAWSGGPGSVLLAVLSGAFIGWWASDRRAAGGLLAALVGALAAFTAMVVARDTALDGSAMAADDLDGFATAVPFVAAGAAAIAAIKRAGSIRRSSGVGALSVLAAFAAAVLALVAFVDKDVELRFDLGIGDRAAHESGAPTTDLTRARIRAAIEEGRERYVSCQFEKEA